tara:strand:+ start:696 stop:1136 length:441 start_codon:yes stop_codon:yes gene_type:complete
MKDKLRVIKTARDKDEINLAANSGFFPLMKLVKPSSKISSKFAIRQDGKNGTIEILGDYREGDGSDCIIGWTNYYPYNFKSPYAAYLIPKDIKIGERVILEDLIEDIVGGRWNQGDAWRLDSCEAIWNGDDFEIQYDENNIQQVIG